MYQILLIVFLVVAVALVALILIQHGKGADMGASFGAGASNTVFGSGGSGNFLTRTTAVLAALFFAVALALGYMTTNQNKVGKASADDIASKITQEQAEETSIPTENDTGIPTDVNEEVVIPAAEAISIPEDVIDEAAVEDVVKEIETKTDEAKKNDSKDGGS